MIIFPVHSCVQRRIIKALRHEGEDRVSQISSDEKTRMELKQHFLYLKLSRKRTNLSSMRQVFRNTKENAQIRHFRATSDKSLSQRLQFMQGPART